MEKENANIKEYITYDIKFFRKQHDTHIIYLFDAYDKTIKTLTSKIEELKPRQPMDTLQNSVHRLKISEEVLPMDTLNNSTSNLRDPKAGSTIEQQNTTEKDVILMDTGI